MPWCSSFRQRPPHRGARCIRTSSRHRVPEHGEADIRVCAYPAYPELPSDPVSFRSARALSRRAGLHEKAGPTHALAPGSGTARAAASPGTTLRNCARGRPPSQGAPGRPPRRSAAFYSMTSVTTPEPTVRPPSRMANLDERAFRPPPATPSSGDYFGCTPSCLRSVCESKYWRIDVILSPSKV